MWYEYSQSPKFKPQFRDINFTSSFKDLLNDSLLKAVIIGDLRRTEGRKDGRMEGWMCECVKKRFDLNDK